MMRRMCSIPCDRDASRRMLRRMRITLVLLLLLFGFVVCGDAYFMMIPSSSSSATVARCHAASSWEKRRRPIGTSILEPRTSPSSQSVLCAASSNALDTGEARRRARQYIQEGMAAFTKGDVAASIERFDQAEQLDASLTPFLWQRGLSLYYANDFAQASRQFRQDVSVNPYDVEEIVWDIASQLRLQTSLTKENGAPVVFPMANPMQLPAGSTDRRRIMRFVYALFRGEGTEEALATAGHAATASLSDEFYSLFYLALFNEARNVPAKAELYLRQALATRYAQESSTSSDYMVSCARVHAQLRGWS